MDKKKGRGEYSAARPAVADAASRIVHGGYCSCFEPMPSLKPPGHVHVHHMAVIVVEFAVGRVFCVNVAFQPRQRSGGIFF